MDIPLPKSNQKRVVIIGAGFAGINLARKLGPSFQVVLLDKNNYHQFQPLLYQVATSGLEASSISFPVRKIFQNKKHVFIRVTEVYAVSPDTRTVRTELGDIWYDYLVMAQGAVTNFYGNHRLSKHAYTMKSVSEALLLRNTLLQNFECALNTGDMEARNALLNVVIVGGGPTGAELAGSIAEMKKRILPKDYHELNFGNMRIYLVEAAPRLLNSMSERSGQTLLDYLHKLGVEVYTGVSVAGYDGESVELSNGQVIRSRCLIWTAGVKGAAIPGIPVESTVPNGRICVDEYNQIKGMKSVFAIGDIAMMQTDQWPKGHPQVAQAAIQQAENLAGNLKKFVTGKQPVPFCYRDKGSMATVGRNLALAEIGKWKIKGLMAWMIWMLVHLLSLIGLKNRLLVLINWIWQYFTYDQSLRLIIRPAARNKHIRIAGDPGVRRMREKALARA